MLLENSSIMFENKWTINNEKSNIDEVAHPGLVSIFTTRNGDVFVINSYMWDL